MGGLRFNSENAGNFRNFEEFFIILLIVKNDAQIQHDFCRFFGSQTRLRTQNLSLGVIFDIQQNNKKTSKFRKFETLELSLSPAYEYDELEN